MFKLFERQPNWALKQLVQETDQPAVCFFFGCFILFLHWNTLILVSHSSGVYTYINALKVTY